MSNEQMRPATPKAPESKPEAKLEPKAAKAAAKPAPQPAAKPAAKPQAKPEAKPATGAGERTETGRQVEEKPRVQALKLGMPNGPAGPGQPGSGQEGPGQAGAAEAAQEKKRGFSLGAMLSGLGRLVQFWRDSDQQPSHGQEEIDYMTDVDAAMLRRGHRFAYLLSAVIGTLFLTVIIWANFAVLDEVTHGRGKVVPTRQVQEIQNLEGGILKEVLVNEGDMVKADQIVARIDNEVAKSQYRDAVTKSLEAKAAIACIDALLNDAEVRMPQDVLDQAPQIAADQQSSYAARNAQHQSELRVLENQKEQKEQEVHEMLGRMHQIEQRLNIALEELRIAKPLADKEIMAKTDYLALKDRVVTLRGDLQALNLGLPRVRKAVEEFQSHMEQREAEYRSLLLDERNELNSHLKSYQQTLAAGEDRVIRTEVRSPVDGTVKRILINTIGGVVQPGQSIMEIVPQDEFLLIEARIRPSDIAFIRPDQKALIKLTAYDFGIYGGLEGEVTSISADTIEDERGETFYLVRLRTKGNSLKYRGEELPIITGMTADVDILTGKKTVLDYLLKPILKAKQNALRER